MNRGAAWTGSLLFATGLSIFAWKTLVLHLPVLPSNVENLWRVELEIDARGSGQRGSVRAALPDSDSQQEIFDERQTNDRLVFSIRTDKGQRTGVWTGAFEGVHNISDGFRVQLSDQPLPLPTDLTLEPPAEIADAYLHPSARFPSEAPEVRELLAKVAPANPGDPLGQMRLLLGYVADEILTASAGSDDALLTLAAGEGSPVGKARLLVALLRASGYPARICAGLRLRTDKEGKETAWAEAWVGGEWISLSPSLGFFGARPPDLLLLRTGSSTLVDETGLDAFSSRYRVLRESLRAEEVASFMVPSNPVLAALSLYRLPVGSQSALRILLVFPIGALIIAVIRNLIGVRTFGTFMPLLISLALRELPLGLGLGLVGSVIALGIVSRLLLERLQLLLVPRLGVLLCLVVLAITAQSLLGRTYEVKDLFASVLFPVVIMTMLIERFSITSAEEGLPAAVRRLTTSTLAAICVYPIFRIAALEHLMFGFPELVLSVMGVLVWMGAYTGYRAAELWRFRTLLGGREGDTP
ncbi:MAG: UUP1 family membrane protein [Myxococcota bacterium]